VAWDEKWWWFEQRFEVGGEVHAVGRVKALFRGPKGNVPTAALLEAAGLAGARQPEMPESIRIWQQAEDAERRGT
jgi:hypothetical protein